MFKLFHYIINIIKDFILRIEPQIEAVIKKVFAETEHKFVSKTQGMFDVLYRFEQRWDIILNKLEDDAAYAVFRIFEGKWLRKIIEFEKRSEIMFRAKEDKLAAYFVKFVIHVIRLVAKVVSFIIVTLHVDEKLHVILCEKEDKLVSDFIKYLHSREFFYALLSVVFFLSVLVMVTDFNYYLTLLLQKDVLLNNFVTLYYYYFFCLISFFGYVYYSITYYQYNEDYISKFFIILSSAVVTYFLFYYFFISGADNQVPEITALLVSDSAGSVNPVSYSQYVAVKAFSILLVYVLIMFYFLRNTISIVSELLIDYMDPEHDMVMKFFKMFIYTLIFFCIPYLFSDIII